MFFSETHNKYVFNLHKTFFIVNRTSWRTGPERPRSSPPWRTTPTPSPRHRQRTLTWSQRPQPAWAPSSASTYPASRTSSASSYSSVSRGLLELLVLFKDSWLCLFAAVRWVKNMLYGLYFSDSFAILMVHVLLLATFWGYYRLKSMESFFQGVFFTIEL